MHTALPVRIPPPPGARIPPRRQTTCEHTCRHTQAPHTHTYAHIHLHTHTDTQTCTCTSLCTDAHRHTHVHMRNTCPCALASRHVCAATCTGRYTHARTDVCTQSPMNVCPARTYLHAHRRIGTHVCAEGSTNARVHTHTYFSCKQGLLTSQQESKVSRHAKVWTRTRPSGSVHFHAGDNSRSFPPAPRRGVSSPQGQFLRTQLVRNNSFTIIISVRFGSRAPSSCRTERARETEENPPEHWATPLRKPAQAELPGQPPRAEGRSAVTKGWPLTHREQELRSACKTCRTPWLPRMPSGAWGKGHTSCSRPKTRGWPELPCKHAFQEASPGRVVGRDHSHPGQ